MESSLSLHGKKFAVLVTNGYEDSELAKPVEAVNNAGGKITIVSLKAGAIEGDGGSTTSVDAVISDVSADDYDGLVLPGGVKNPDTLRINQVAVNFVKSFFAAHKPVGAICHGPWLLVEADVLEGRTVTSWPSLKTDIENAGGNWIDQSVVTDNGLVTSRKPDDLPDFCAKLVEEFGEGKHEKQTV